MHYSQQVATISEISKDLFLHYEDIKSRNGWCNEDVRIAVFGQLVNELTPILTMMATYSDCISNLEWLCRNAKSDMENFGIMLTESDKIFKKIFFLNSWAVVENAIRRISSHIGREPVIGSICSVLENLLSRKKLNHDNKNDLLHLLRLITTTRNTSHNGFYFYPDNIKERKDGVVYRKYKNKKYKFEVGAEVDFFDWDFVIFCLQEMFSLMDQIIEHPKVKEFDFIPYN